MAGLPWFEMDVDFHENPKVRALQHRLREPLADAYVARLYAYCYRHAYDRFDAEVAVGTIEDAAGWRRRRGALFDALFAEGFLERDAGKIVVHGVRERLAPHLAKRLGDAERQRRRRDRAAQSIGHPRDVTRDIADPVTRDSRGDKDKDRDSDKEASPPTPGPAGEDDLVDFRQKLAVRLGVQKVHVGKNRGSVLAFFRGQLDAVGEDVLLEDCARVAVQSTSGVPTTLSWFVGWLERLPNEIREVPA